MRILAIAAAAEAVVGLALVLAPSAVTGPLLGAQATGIATVTSRVAGIALVALAVACWPRGVQAAHDRAYAGLLSYNVLAALLFVHLGLADGPRGILLWPAVAIHAVFAVLLALAWASHRRSATKAGAQAG